MQVLAGIVIFFLVLYLLYLFVVHVLPVLIVLALYGAAVYYSIRRLRVQLTQRYRLTAASALFLLAIALGTLLLAALITHAGVPSWLALILAIPFLLGACVLTLELWALAKCWPYWGNVLRQRRKIREYSNQLEAVSQQLSRLSRQIERLEARYGTPLREQAELQQIIQKLCQRDAENLTIKRRQWQEEFTKLSDEKLRRCKREAIAQATAQKPLEEQIPLTIKASLLRLEELKRLVGVQGDTLQKNRRALDKKVHEEQELRRKLGEAQDELARLEATYRAFRASRIVLD